MLPMTRKTYPSHFINSLQETRHKISKFVTLGYYPCQQLWFAKDKGEERWGRQLARIIGKKKADAPLYLLVKKF